MKSLHDAVYAIQNTNWTFNNNFDVQFLFGDNSLGKESGLDGLDLNLYIKQCQIPQIGTSNVIDKFILDRPRIAMGIWESTTFDFEFYDYDNLSLYKKFVYYVAKERYAYFDEYKFQVKLTKLGDHKNDENEQHVITMDNCYFQNVSAITLNNESEAQILEFSVQVKSASIESVDGFLHINEDIDTLPTYLQHTKPN